MVDLLRMSALDLAECIRRREVSSEEATGFFLERIDRYDHQLTSFVTVMASRALRAARRMDQQIAQSRDPDELPTFFGVPVGIKDLVPMLGTPTKLGSRAYQWLVSPFDAPAAKQMKRGGFVVLGKLATSEFGVLPVTEPDIHAPTRNPWNTDHTPGGSSGGSGAAVAAGLIPLAHGSDGGGSVRIPASFCHLYGFKPSLSLLGNMHGNVNKLGISTMGPLTHYVEDAAALLDVLAGRAHHRRFATDSCLAQSRLPPRRLRIAVCTGSPIGKVEPAIADAVERTGKVLQDLGHEVRSVEMLEAGLDDFLPIWQYQLAGVPVWNDRLLQPVTQWLRREGRQRKLADVLRIKQKLETDMHSMIDGADVMLTATTPVSPPPIGAFDSLGPEEQFAAAAPIGALTAGYNVTLGPAATLPAGLTEAGLPFGVQIGARPGEDYLVLSLSKQLEDAMPWRERRTDIFNA
jgi:amidase